MEKKRQKLFESFNCATEGFLYVFKSQKNMKIHFIFAVVIFLISIFLLKVSRYDILLIAFAISFVLITEMINTALELTLDMISDTYHPLARIIKDISAGAVLIASVNAIIVGFLLLTRYIDHKIVFTINWIIKTPWYFTFICLFLVFLATLGLKIFMHRGTPFRGGMPSAHAALAFACWTLITLFTKNPVVVVLGFFIAFMVAQGRVSGGIHTIREVFLGSVLGVLISILFYQIARIF